MAITWIKVQVLHLLEILLDRLRLLKMLFFLSTFILFLFVSLLLISIQKKRKTSIKCVLEYFYSFSQLFSVLFWIESILKKKEIRKKMRLFCCIAFNSNQVFCRVVVVRSMSLFNFIFLLFIVFNAFHKINREKKQQQQQQKLVKEFERRWNCKWRIINEVYYIQPFSNTQKVKKKTKSENEV